MDWRECHAGFCRLGCEKLSGPCFVDVLRKGVGAFNLSEKRAPQKKKKDERLFLVARDRASICHAPPVISSARPGAEETQFALGINNALLEQGTEVSTCAEDDYDYCIK